MVFTPMKGGILSSLYVLRFEIFFTSINEPSAHLLNTLVKLCVY